MEVALELGSGWKVGRLLRHWVEKAQTGLKKLVVETWTLNMTLARAQKGGRRAEENVRFVLGNECPQCREQIAARHVNVRGASGGVSGIRGGLLDIGGKKILVKKW